MCTRKMRSIASWRYTTLSQFTRLFLYHQQEWILRNPLRRQKKLILHYRHRDLQKVTNGNIFHRLLLRYRTRDQEKEFQDQLIIFKHRRKRGEERRQEKIEKIAACTPEAPSDVYGDASAQVVSAAFHVSSMSNVPESLHGRSESRGLFWYWLRQLETGGSGATTNTSLRAVKPFLTPFFR